MSEGVGKRIVDALKKQGEVDLANNINVEETTVAPNVAEVEPEPVAVAQEAAFNFETPFVNQQTVPSFNTTFVTPQPEVAVQHNMYSTAAHNFSDISNIEVPANVAILRQLISQLPSGVSRQAGALVIKQTMEALGISMKAVLSEAQQLQESINASARDCQNNILECKKQINTLEAQVQTYQKQSASLNDIVSLFLQLN